MNQSPVFLLASERSGTNLLRKLITEHQKIYFGPSPAHFLKNLFFIEPYYGDLYVDDNFVNLIEDALKLCYIHFSPWSIKLTAHQVFEAYLDQNYAERNSVFLSHFLMTSYAQEQGYQSYFCKDNKLNDFVFEILYYLPNSKFIYLYRDPRDVVLSQLERSLQTDSVYKLASLWKKEQVKCISCHQKLSNTQIFKLSYEELIECPNRSLKEICNFLNVTYIKEKNNGVNIHTGMSAEWKNLNKPIMTNNYKKYLEKLNKRQVQLIEDSCFFQMQYLNYSFEYDRKYFGKISKIRDVLSGEIRSRIRQKIKPEAIDSWACKRQQLLSKFKI